MPRPKDFRGTLVKDLIKKLQEFDPNLEIRVDLPPQLHAKKYDAGVLEIYPCLRTDGSWTVNFELDYQEDR